MPIFSKFKLKNKIKTFSGRHYNPDIYAEALKLLLQPGKLAVAKAQVAESE